jgi:hypothetical protein
VLDTAGPLAGAFVIVSVDGALACGVLRGDRLPGLLRGALFCGLADLGAGQLERAQDHTAPQV